MQVEEPVEDTDNIIRQGGSNVQVRTKGEL